MLFCLATLFCACGGRVILEQGGTSEGTTGAGGAETSGVYTSSVADVGVGVTTTTTSGGPGSASSSSGGTPDPKACGAYCAEVMNNCVGDSVNQYSDDKSCLNVCSTFPVGKVGDMSGNSLECRAYHAAAAKAGNPSIHCAHAGPTGGDLDPADLMPGPCGDGCEAFCNLALQICPATFDGQQDCRAQCQKFGASFKPYSTQDTTGNTFACRMYHLSVAARDATTALVHCPHIVFFSPTCK